MLQAAAPGSEGQSAEDVFNQYCEPDVPEIFYEQFERPTVERLVDDYETHTINAKETLDTNNINPTLKFDFNLPDGLIDYYKDFELVLKGRFQFKMANMTKKNVQNEFHFPVDETQAPLNFNDSDFNNLSSIYSRLLTHKPCVPGLKPGCPFIRKCLMKLNELPLQNVDNPSASIITNFALFKTSTSQRNYRGPFKYMWNEGIEPDFSQEYEQAHNLNYAVNTYVYQAANQNVSEMHTLCKDNNFTGVNGIPLHLTAAVPMTDQIAPYALRNINHPIIPRRTTSLTIYPHDYKNVVCQETNNYNMCTLPTHLHPSVAMIDYNIPQPYHYKRDPANGRTITNTSAALSERSIPNQLWTKLEEGFVPGSNIKPFMFSHDKRLRSIIKTKESDGWYKWEMRVPMHLLFTCLESMRFMTGLKKMQFEFTLTKKIWEFMQASVGYDFSGTNAYAYPNDIANPVNIANEQKINFGPGHNNGMFTTNNYFNKQQFWPYWINEIEYTTAHIELKRYILNNSPLKTELQAKMQVEKPLPFMKFDVREYTIRGQPQYYENYNTVSGLTYTIHFLKYYFNGEQYDTSPRCPYIIAANCQPIVTKKNLSLGGQIFEKGEIDYEENPSMHYKNYLEVLPDPYSDSHGPPLNEYRFYTQHFMLIQNYDLNVKNATGQNYKMDSRALTLQERIYLKHPSEFTNNPAAYQIQVLVVEVKECFAVISPNSILKVLGINK